jgi:6-bladed beta-propeller
MARTRSTLASAAVVVLSLLSFVSAASADKVISEVGSDPGQTLQPGGLATDFKTGRLYVADTGNNRIQVFDENGAFVKAFGKNGSGPGQFEEPRSIAVDNSASPANGDVYVVDSGNSRIQRFGPEGEFKLAFGSKGSGEGQLNFDAGPVLVGVGPGGVVYVVDNLKAGSEFEYRLQKFDSSGVPIPPQIVLSKGGVLVRGLALNSTGDLYISFKTDVIQKYDKNGNFVEEIADPFEDAGIYEFAVGENDHLFLASSESGAIVSVMELDAAGNRVRRFGYGAMSMGSVATAVASAPGTGVYLGEAQGELSTIGNRVLRIDFPPPGPLVFPKPCTADPLGNAKATLEAAIDPEGKATTYRFQYISEADFVANGESFSGADPASETPESAPIGSDFHLHKASAQVSPLVPETKYRCRVIATNADAPAGNPGPEGGFETKAPLEITETSVSAVGAEEATLNAELNPLGIPATGFFEYVTEAAFGESGFATATKAPAGDPLDFGGGEEPVLRSTQLTGLDPATTYRYRLVATDILISPEGKTVISSTRTFRTYSPGAGSLPDGRAYELVSPALKNGAEVAVPGVAGGLFNREISTRINAAAGTGEALTYTSWTSFGEDAEGAPGASQYLSKRTPEGWGTENISPRGFLRNPQEAPYRGFTSDLGFGAFIVDEPALTPEAQEGFENLYLRDIQTGEVQALTTAAPQLVGPFTLCTAYAGTSADGSRAIFAGRGALAGTGAPLGEGFSLYEWSASGGLGLVSVLPDGEPAPPVLPPPTAAADKGTGFGAAGSTCTMDQAVVRNAISADGSVVFWHYGGKYGSSKEPLFARLGGTETIQLDAKPEENAGKGPFGQGTFRAGTSDGKYAFFTALGKLTKDAEAAGHIYRYDTQSRSLLDLTPGAIAPQVQGVVGASEDGTRIYFAATGVLTGEEENEAGQKATPGSPNLYLWHEGEGLRFIATLGALDESAWSTSPERLTGRVTPDGRHLAFFSTETKVLSGFDNRISAGTGCQPTIENKLEGDQRCAEAYLYDAEADSLDCVSCNPSGSRPTGPSEVPGWTNPYEGPRYLSDDGSRLFFESRDVLSPADTNGKRDVYEYEVEGAGSCSEDSPGFDPASGGCLRLITSGQSEDESFFVDASSDGRDVFFSTRSTLTGWDTNESYDVYDARVGGGFPEPPPPPVPCAGEACPPPPSAAPLAPTAATPNFQGAGNPPAKKPGRKARHHKKKHKHQAKKRKGAGQKRSGR